MGRPSILLHHKTESFGPLNFYYFRLNGYITGIGDELLVLTPDTPYFYDISEQCPSNLSAGSEWKTTAGGGFTLPENAHLVYTLDWPVGDYNYPWNLAAMIPYAVYASDEIPIYTYPDDIANEAERARNETGDPWGMPLVWMSGTTAVVSGWVGSGTNFCDYWPDYLFAYNGYQPTGDVPPLSGDYLSHWHILQTEAWEDFSWDVVFQQGDGSYSGMRQTLFKYRYVGACPYAYCDESRTNPYDYASTYYSTHYHKNADVLVSVTGLSPSTESPVAYVVEPLNKRQVLVNPGSGIINIGLASGKKRNIFGL